MRSADGLPGENVFDQNDQGEDQQRHSILPRQLQGNGSGEGFPEVAFWMVTHVRKKAAARAG
jgi:hypothetical protein